MESKKKNNAIKDRIKRLLESQKLADIHFLLGEPPKDRILPSHKLILSLASPVFEEMFYGDNPIEEDLVTVPDVDPEAFKTMLEYIYSDRKKLNSFEQAFQVYYVARKYSLSNLMDSCVKFLISKLKPSNACQAYEFAQYFNETSLMETSMEIIKTNAMEVLEDNNFLDIAPETLMAILDQQKLNMNSELDLFKAVQRYANARVYLLNSSPIKSNQEYQIENSSAVKECFISQNSAENIINLMHPVQEIKVEKNLEGSDQESQENGENDEGMVSAGSSFESTETSESSDTNNSAVCSHHPLPFRNSLVSPGTDEILHNTENLFSETEQTLINSDITLTNSFINAESTIVRANDNIGSPQKSTNDQQNYSKNLNKESNGTNQNYKNNESNENDKNSDGSKYSDSPVNIVSQILSKKRLPVSEEIIRKAVKKIRFLTLTPQEFVKGPALSKLLKRDEAFAILVNIIEQMDECPMPEGFCAY